MITLGLFDLPFLVQYRPTTLGETTIEFTDSTFAVLDCGVGGPWTYNHAPINMIALKRTGDTTETLTTELVINSFDSDPTPPVFDGSDSSPGRILGIKNASSLESSTINWIPGQEYAYASLNSTGLTAETNNLCSITMSGTGYTLGPKSAALIIHTQDCGNNANVLRVTGTATSSIVYDWQPIISIVAINRVVSLPAGGPITTVDYSTVAGTAVAGVNYTAINGTFTWPDYSDTAEKIVTVTDIVSIGADKYFDIVFSNTSSLSLLAYPSVYRVHILSGSVISFIDASYTGTSFLSTFVTRTGDLSYPLEATVILENTFGPPTIEGSPNLIWASGENDTKEILVSGFPDYSCDLRIIPLNGITYVPSGPQNAATGSYGLVSVVIT